MALPAVAIAILTVLVWRKYYNKVVLFFCLLSILICAGFCLAKGLPKVVKKVNIYHIVFYTALQEAQDKPKLLSVLNLPANAEKYAGTSAFEASTALYLPEIYPAMNLSLLAKLAKYYLNHPKEFFNLIKKTTTHINEPDRAILTDEKNLFSWWLKMKNKIFPKSPYSLLALFVITAGISFLNFKSNPSNKIDRGLFYLQVLTILGAITSFFSALGDGLFDIKKHLWPFNLFFDILIINLLLNFYIWFDKVKYKLKGI